MTKAHKSRKRSFSYALAIITIAGILLAAATITPIASENTSAAIWKSRIAPSITMTINTADPVIGKNVHADCTLRGLYSTTGARVSVSVTLPDGAVAYPIRGPTAYTSSTGKFVIDYTPTMAGMHKFTATYGGNMYYPSASKSVTFNVMSPFGTDGPLKSTSTMQLNMASTSVKTGDSIHANGVLSGSTGIAGATVGLKVTLPNGGTAYPTQGATTTTDSSGKFAMDYVASMEGTYKFTATFSGNSLFSESSAVASSTASATTSTPPSLPPTTTPEPEPEPTTSVSYKYIVSSNGGTYVAKSASTGATIASGSNAASVIQSALSALSAGRTTKEAVLLQGSFVLTKAINVPSYTILQLDGKVTRGANDYMIYGNGVSYVDIIGGEWDGNKATYTTDSIDGFVFSKSHYVTIGGTSSSTMLNIYGTTYHPINCYKSDHVTIRYVNAHDNGDWNNVAYRAPGIMMYACSDSTVENCHIHDTSKGGIYFYTEDDGVSETLSNNVVQNNLVERTWTTGIEVGNRGTNDVCTGNVIRGNTVVDGGMDGEHMGIAVGWWGPTSGAVRYANSCTVTGNTLYQTGKYSCGGGISLMAHDSTCSNNVVRDISTVAVGCRGDRNTIAGNDIDRSGIGIQFWDGSNNEVTTNTITSCDSGIALYKGLTAGCSNNHIADNRIESSTNVAILINEAGDTGNIIENNVFVGKSTIVNQGTGTIIRNNSVL